MSDMTIIRGDVSFRDLFDGERPVAPRDREPDPTYLSDLSEAQRIYNAALHGNRWDRLRFQEAMTTSDFPLLFADVLERELLPRYREAPSVWRSHLRRKVVSDFRDAKVFAVDGAEGRLGPVGERGEYPEQSLDESEDTVAVSKFGRRLSFSFEQMVNDDLDAFRDAPDRLARGARRTEDHLATTLYVGTAGPHADLYKTDHETIDGETVGNVITGNPALDINGLEAGFQTLDEMVDRDGEPIVVEQAVLVVPPALRVTAMNLLEGIQIRVNEAGGATNSTVVAPAWMSGAVSLEVNPYIPVVADSNGATSWFLFASPEADRPAAVMGFLSGFEEPGLFRRIPDAERVGAGSDEFSFDTDSIDWKVRHVTGGARTVSTGGWRATVASDGTGS